MKMPLILFAALAGSFSAVAADFVLSDGTVLKEASVVRRSVDSVLVRHSNGVQKLFFDRLSPELQKQLGMTPELVAERRAAAEQASAERRRQRAEAQAARLAALQASGQYPRYLSGADIFTLFSEAATLTAPTAEYLAALWNHREATRLNLPADAERYAADMATRRPSAERELATLRAAHRARQEAKELREQIARLQQQNAALQAQLANNRPTSTTVVVDNPVYVPTPTYVPVPAPVVRPGPPRPPHRHGPPPRRPRPVIHSDKPSPASSAHTIPRW